VALKWPLARVFELLPGRDGVAPVAVLRTPTGFTKRGVNELCLLRREDGVECNASNVRSMSGLAAASST